MATGENTLSRENKARRHGKGRLISFEGLDGAGKTTQMELLERWLQAQTISYVRTREPGGTPLGVELRGLLLNRPELAIAPLAEALLFQADRAQHFATLVIPALDEGKLVITDRCFDASIAYQGYARGVGPELVERLSLLATRGLVPDLTILLDLDPSQVHNRTDATTDTSGLRAERTRFDAEAEAFHTRVQEGFRALARQHPERIKVVDASRSVEEIHREIVGLVRQAL
ncbi:MAG TPA: dTMP kinase [Ktedonobacteraceae bacterium]|nr:dTMP kinase [Ktedonobacteraceae bacterium]